MFRFINAIHDNWMDRTITAINAGMLLYYTVEGVWTGVVIQVALTALLWDTFRNRILRGHAARFSLDMMNCCKLVHKNDPNACSAMLEAIERHALAIDELRPPFVKRLAK